MKILCAFGKHAYGHSGRGISYEYTNFLPAFDALGHEVVFFDIWDKEKYEDFAELNSAFIHTIKNEMPDIVFCVLMGYELWTETFDLIREKYGVVLVNWSTDDSWKYEQFSRYVARSFDIYVTTYLSAYKKSKLDGYSNFIVSQWAANSKYLREPRKADDCEYDVTFVGAAYGNRRKWIRSLKSRGINVECFGYGWENGVIKDSDIPAIINNSVICLNFSDSGLMFKGIVPYRSRQIKARIFEVPGAGGFLVTEMPEKIEKYYTPGVEIVAFNNVFELTEIINKYLKNHTERDSIALHGYNRTIREHTYEMRFEEIIQIAISKINDKKSSSPSLSNDWSTTDDRRFNEVLIKHKTGALLKFFRILLLTPCILLWGKTRGGRAARRIIFELSWRLAGAKTYSSTGLPGRLFYRES